MSWKRYNLKYEDDMENTKNLQELNYYYIIAIYLLNNSYMASVFFNINTTQEKEIKKLMREEGYTNKAEFFRFLIKYYKYNTSPELRRLDQEAYELGEVIKKLDMATRKKLSFDERFKDV